MKKKNKADKKNWIGNVIPNLNYLLFFFLLFFLFIIMILSVSALEVGTKGQIGLNLGGKEKPVNYSLVNTNSSEYWITNEGTLDNVVDILLSWITPTNFDFLNHNLTNINYLSAKVIKGFFNWTTSSDYLNFDGYILSFNDTKLHNTINQSSLWINKSNIITSKNSNVDVTQNLSIQNKIKLTQIKGIATIDFIK